MRHQNPGRVGQAKTPRAPAQGAAITAVRVPNQMQSRVIASKAGLPVAIRRSSATAAAVK